jgi:hypothetical protein
VFAVTRVEREFQIPNSPHQLTNSIPPWQIKLVFHLPFNNVTVIGMMTMVVGLGVGSMVYGVCHQQVRVNRMKRFDFFLRDNFFSFNILCLFFWAVQTRILEIERS